MTSRWRWIPVLGLVGMAASLHLAAMASSASNTVPQGELPCDRIELVHIGPQDASLPRIRIATGKLRNSTNALLLLPNSNYQAVRIELSQSAEKALARPLRFGTFEVEIFVCASDSVKHAIGPEAFLSTLEKLSGLFTTAHPLPDSLNRIKTMVQGSLLPAKR